MVCFQLVCLFACACDVDVRKTIPQFVKMINVFFFPFFKEMAKILNHPRVYAFLHIPVQSASDSVLMEMKREYCVADFKRVVDFLKEK